MISKIPVLIVVVLLSFSVEAFAVNEQEVNVLIDVSGSMKENDPNALRVPALKLMINLLPEGQKVGIWLFSEQVRALMEPGIVDQQWKQRALQAAEKIHSRGLYTDLEDALWVASSEWLKQVESTKRSLVLLTDGVIDISNDIEKCDESRARIITELLPLLQKAGVNIQTIALSEQADLELLKKLSLDTNGWNKSIRSANQLQRSFLEMFNKAEPQEILPIKDNKFVVDVTIKEISVLVFKKAASEATKLITPDDKEIQKTTPEKGVIWLGDEGYDLITVKNPMPGEWLIDASADTDNQVMVITDLQMKTSQLPNQIVKQDAVAVTLHFVDNGNLITRSDFLSILKLTVQLVDASGNTAEWPLTPVADKAGYFSYVFDKALPEGVNTIRIKADGKTFVREVEQTIEVVNNPILVESVIDRENNRVVFTLTPDHYFIDSSTLDIKVRLDSPPAEPAIVNVQTKEGRWLFNVDFDENQRRKVVNFSVTAKTLAGKKIQPDVRAVIIDEAFLQSQEEQNKLIERPIDDGVFEKTQLSGQKAKTTGLDEQDKTEVKNGQKQDSEEPGGSWYKTAAMIVIANIFVFGGGFFAFRWYRKRSQEKQEGLLNKLSS